MQRNKELEEKIITYRILEAKLDSLLKQRELITSKLVEINSTLASIDEIEKSEEVLFPIGAEAYTLGKIINKKKLIVEIGANIAMEKTIEEGKETLNKRKIELENALKNIQNEIVKVTNAINAIAPEIQELAKKSE